MRMLRDSLCRTGKDTFTALRKHLTIAKRNLMSPMHIGAAWGLCYLHHEDFLITKHEYITLERGGTLDDTLVITKKEAKVRRLNNEIS